MGNRSKLIKVRTPGTVCKPTRPRHGWGTAAQAGLFGTLLLLVGCTATHRPRTITVAELEAARPAPKPPPVRSLVSDARPLQEMCIPLGERLGLLQVRSDYEWQQLNLVAPQAGPHPDFRTGTLVGVACWVGSPVNGEWPVHIDNVRIKHGAGLVNGYFAPGTYLPDGTAYLETVFVDGLRGVLMVDISGTTFYPE